MGLDPFAGNASNPQSYNKYLYTGGDPVNGIDPTGKFSIGSTLASVGIGAIKYGAITGAIVGAANSGFGVVTGQMDYSTAVQSWAKFALLGGAVQAVYKIHASLSLGMSVLLGVGELIVGEEIARRSGGLAEGVHGLFRSFVQPENTIRAIKSSIIDSSRRNRVPPDLVAAVLLAELNDYSVGDFLFDDEVLVAPEKHSLGIAQLRIDNVRNWDLRVPGHALTPAKTIPGHIIRAALNTNEYAIELLAQFVRRAADKGPIVDHPALGLFAGTAVDFDGWDNRPLRIRANIAFLFGVAKDDIDGALHVAKGDEHLQAHSMLERVHQMGLLR